LTVHPIQPNLLQKIVVSHSHSTPLTYTAQADNLIRHTMSSPPEGLSTYRLPRLVPQVIDDRALRRAHAAYRNPDRANFPRPDPTPPYIIHNDIAGMNGGVPPSPLQQSEPNGHDWFRSPYKQVDTCIFWFCFWIGVSSVFHLLSLGGWSFAAIGWSLGKTFVVLWALVVTAHCFSAATCVDPDPVEIPEPNPCDRCGVVHHGVLCPPSAPPRL